jgi:hypothetical protein
MTIAERTLAALRKTADAHRKAGAVPVTVLDTLIHELEADAPRELEALARCSELEPRGPVRR